MKWNKEDDSVLENLVKRGFNNNEISDNINRTVSSIKNRRVRLGLVKPTKIYQFTCLECGKISSGVTKNYERTFCDNHCANTWTNKHRVLSDNTKKKISLKMSGELNPNYIDGRSKMAKPPKPVKSKKCKLCGVNDVFGRRMVCDKCKYLYYEQYRPATRFTFNVYDYPDEFNIDLVNEFGWYSPTNKGNNPTGVSKDHMLSVGEGFKLGVNINILSHPANCQLMKQSDNSSKNSNSSITLNELMDKVNKWDKKYG